MILVFIFTTLIIVAGFVFVLHIFLSHIKRLEVFLKATSLHEAKHFEKIEHEEAKVADEPEHLTEVFNDKSPEEIRSSFQ